MKTLINKTRVACAMERLLYQISLVCIIFTTSCSLVPYYDADVIQKIEETQAMADRFYYLMEIDTTSQNSYSLYKNAEPIYYDMVLELRRINRMNDYRKKSGDSKQQITALINVIETTREEHEKRGSFKNKDLIALERSQIMDGFAAIRETEKRLPKQNKN